MKYEIERTDTADSLIRRIVLYIAENCGNEVALAKLDYLEKSIMSLGENPYIGTEPRYTGLRRQDIQNVREFAMFCHMRYYR